MNGEIVALQLAEGVNVDYPASSTLTLPNVGTAGTYGGAASVPVFTTDAQGRVTAVTPTAIAIAAPAVSYDNTISGLTATNVKTAIDEVVSMIPAAGVTSFNTLTGAVTISAGANITLTPTGNDIEISASGGGGAVSSVNSQTGAVVLDAGDIGLDPTVTGQSTVQAGIDYVFGQIPSLAGLVPSSRTLTGASGELTIAGFSGVAADLTLDRTIGLVAVTTGDTVGALSNEVIGFSFDNFGRITSTSSTPISNVPITGITGNNYAFAGFDGSGVGRSVPGWSVDATTGGLRTDFSQNVTDAASNTLHNSNVNLNASEDSPSTTWNHLSLRTEIDSGDAGFDIGTGGNAARMITMDYFHDGLSNTGSLDFIVSNFNVGNGTDPIDVNGMGYCYGFGQFNANVTISGAIQGYGFQPSVNAGATMAAGSQITAFYDNSNIQADMVEGYTVFNAGPQLALIPDSVNLLGFNFGPTVTDFAGSGGVYGVVIGGTYGVMGPSSNWNGVSVNPDISSARYAAGINVTMDNVTLYAGVASDLTEQDLTFTFSAPGDNNAYTLEYTTGATAGAEVVTILGQAITVQIEDNVSTATQVKAAMEAIPALAAAITITISGVGGNAQVAFGPTNFANGENPGRKQAAYFDGDVEITGAISFGGALSIGQLNAFYAANPVDGGGNPQGLHGLVTSMTALDSVTTANGDAIGVNTAMLITLEDNSVTTSGPFQLGFCALALPCVVTTHTGATLDYMSAATYALSLDGASTGGTIDTVRICRSVPIPNGVTTINNLYGFYYHEPFGAVSSRNFGFYSEDAAYNWFENGVKIGGTAGSSDTTAHKLEVEGAAMFDGNLGFFGTTPISQPAGGAATAGGTYTATEQTMLQAVYDAVRALGLMA